VYNKKIKNWPIINGFRVRPIIGQTIVKEFLKKLPGIVLYRKSGTVTDKKARWISIHQKLSALQRWTRGLGKSFVLQRS